MAPIKKRVLPIVAAVVGILTVRQLRKRRAGTDETESSDGGHDESSDEGDEEPKTAVEHATAASEHARLAAEKVVENHREE